VPTETSPTQVWMPEVCGSASIAMSTELWPWTEPPYRPNSRTSVTSRTAKKQKSKDRGRGTARNSRLCKAFPPCSRSSHSICDATRLSRSVLGPQSVQSDSVGWPEGDASSSGPLVGVEAASGPIGPRLPLQTIQRRQARGHPDTRGPGHPIGIVGHVAQLALQIRRPAADAKGR
jgi:hypothetical protein